MSDVDNIPADFVLCDELARELLGRDLRKGEYVTLSQKHGEDVAYSYNTAGNVTDSVVTPLVTKDISTVHLYAEQVDKLKKRSNKLKICCIALVVSVLLFTALAWMILQTIV